MYILALDQSTRKTGWAAIDDDGIVRSWGLIKTPSKYSGLEAARYQAHEVDALMDLIPIRTAKIVAIEDLHTGKNTSPKIIYLLGALRGMLVYIVGKRDLRYVICGSKDVCDFIGVSAFCKRDAKKRASKQAAAMELWQDRSRWTEMQEDIADAICIGKIAYQKLRLEAMMENGV